MGLFIVFFLIEHLFTNSQAALLIGEDGSGFVRMVNFIKNLPYLPVIELTLLGIPFFIHILWGLHYLFTAKQNCYGKGDNAPHLPEYPRNHAYTWQRITSWILVFGIIGHVAQMRFIDYPTSAKRGSATYYMAPVTLDQGIYTVAQRLDVTLYTKKQVKQLLSPPNEVTEVGKTGSFFASIQNIFLPSEPQEAAISKSEIDKRLQDQKLAQERGWISALESWELSSGQGIAVADNFGTIELMLVRETFKYPIYLILYTLFVLAACYHGFNGLWTFCITWGLTLTDRSQRHSRLLTTLLMALITFFGLAAIWGTYWINLRQ